MAHQSYCGNMRYDNCGAYQGNVNGCDCDGYYPYVKNDRDNCCPPQPPPPPPYMPPPPPSCHLGGYHPHHPHHPPHPIPDFPTSGPLFGNAFGLNGNASYLFDSSHIQYGPFMSYSENINTRVVKRSDSSCINLSATFDMTDSLLTNTAIMNYIEQNIINRYEELDGLLPILKSDITFKLYYTIYDPEGMAVSQSVIKLSTPDMKMHCTDIRDKFAFSCKGLMVVNIPHMDYRGMYTINLDRIEALMDVVDTLNHSKNGVTDLYSFADNNSKIILQHENINRTTADGYIIFAACDINKSFTFQGNVSTRLKLQFTSFLPALGITGNTYSIWSALTDPRNAYIRDLQRTIEELSLRVDSMEQKIEDLSSVDSTVIEEIKGQIDNLENNKVDKEAGKGLSSNDYTDEDKQLLQTLVTSGQVVFNKFEDLPETGSEGILYVDKEERLIYFWNDAASEYVSIIIDIDTIQGVLNEASTN